MIARRAAAQSSGRRRWTSPRRIVRSSQAIGIETMTHPTTVTTLLTSSGVLDTQGTEVRPPGTWGEVPFSRTVEGGLTDA